MPAPAPPPGAVRVDRWLWAARFFKTRALAAAAVAAGRVTVNGARAKPAKPVRAGDLVALRLGPFEYRLTVEAVSARRGPPAGAARLYAEDAEGRRRRERHAEQLRAAPAPVYEGKGRPTKRDRRRIERLRGD